MRIEFLANDGSPIGVIPQDIYERGVGGAEMGLLSLAETLAERGHEVAIYNDPRIPGAHNGIEFRTLTTFDSRAPRDALVIFRSPNARVEFQHLGSAKAIWWSTDQYTVGNFAELAAKVDFVVTISPFHTRYHNTTYGIPMTKMGHIDLGVRLREYAGSPEKVEGRCIFCSVPDRGLMILHAAWPLIKRIAPAASLTITADYRLWGQPSPGNHMHRLNWAGVPDVSFLGAVPRSELVRLQQEAMILAYPCTYEELFCISAAECQVAGALPVVTPIGALPTTAEFGITIPGTPTAPDFVERFSSRIASLLTDERAYLGVRQASMQEAARRRFDWNSIAAVWERLFEKGRLD